MRFEFLGPTKANIHVEFKSHEDLLDAHNLLKEKYFGNAFVFTSIWLFNARILRKILTAFAVSTQFTPMEVADHSDATGDKSDGLDFL